MQNYGQQTTKDFNVQFAWREQTTFHATQQTFNAGGSDKSISLKNSILEKDDKTVPVAKIGLEQSARHPTPELSYCW